jgi:1-acyl-sn-glycerol-3-phosphate acyltransferase
MVLKYIKMVIVSLVLLFKMTIKNRTRKELILMKKEWSGKIMKILDLEVKYENIEIEEENILIISNHRSFLDILIIENQIQNLNLKNSTFIAKEELKKIPILGSIIVKFKTVFLNRKNPRSFFKTIKEIEKIKEEKNNSFVIFPEGTRNKGNNEVNKFKQGVVKLAQKNKLNILPIYIEGNAEDYFEERKDKRKKINVKIGKIIDINDVKDASDLEVKYKKEFFL